MVGIVLHRRYLSRTGSGVLRRGDVTRDTACSHRSAVALIPRRPMPPRPPRFALSPCGPGFDMHLHAIQCVS
jgi:hypothetical protein